VYERRHNDALAILDAAGRIAHQGDPSLTTRYWVAAVQAEAFAGTGNVSVCQRSLDSSQRVYDLSGRVSNDGWLRFDGERLTEQRGLCYVQLNQPTLARDAEALLLDALGRGLSVRRRGTALVDLATLAAQSRELDKLVAHTNAAIDLLHETHSGVIWRKLSSLHDELLPLRGESRVRDLEKRISASSKAIKSR
jgi:hypothetical protein